jgi:predicted permease
MRQLARRVWYWIRRRRLEADLAEEIAFHREMAEQELRARGVEPGDAARAARRALGNARLAQDQARDVWIWPWLQSVGQDVRFASRLFAREPLLSLAAAGALALGIGASGTVYTIVNAMVLRGLPVDEPDRIVGLLDPASYRDVEDWRSGTRAFAGLGGYVNSSMIVGDQQQSPEVFAGAFVPAGTWGLIGEKPVLGRDFIPDDDRRGAPPVVILGHRVWASRYASDPAIIGRTIRVNGVPSVVVGVMRETVRFPLIAELWQPLALAPGLAPERRDARVLRVFGKLATGVSMGQAQRELDAVAARLSREFPETNEGIRPIVTPFTGSASHAMFVALFGSVAFVVLIACANVANLLLARAARRSREISIRLSLGATRMRIVRQLLVESVLLAVVAGALGFALAVGGVKLFANAVTGINFAYWYHENWTLDGRVAVFLALVTFGTVFVFGGVPAVQLSKPGVTDALKDASRTTTGGRSARRWTSALLVAELAFTLTLLAGASLMIRSFLAVYRADSIVETANLTTASVRLPPAYKEPARRLALYARLEERLAAIPVIGSASFASAVPFIGAPLWSVTIDGRRPAPGERPPRVSYVLAGPRYFETLGVRLVRGRSFSGIDGTPGHEAAIVNQRFVARFFPNEDPIGRRIHAANANAPAETLTATIVGVSPTVRQQFMTELDAVIYFPYRANPGAMAMLMIRSSAGLQAVAALVRQEFRALEPELPLYGFRPMDEWMGQSRWGHRVFGTMFGVFAAIALVLSAVGLFAITAYSVTQRTQEIGVRVALGAEPRQVVWLFLRRIVAPLAIGVALGIGGALGVGRLVRAMLVQTSPADPVALLAIAGLLVVVAVAACVSPARRATRLDPVAALRYE